MIIFKKNFKNSTFVFKKHITEMHESDPSPSCLCYTQHLDSLKIQSNHRSIWNKNHVVITKQAALRTRY